MKRELTAQVGADGVLTLKVPLGREGANQTVRVVLETVEGGAADQALSQKDWLRFVQSMAGRITDPTFDRQPQGDHEQRDELP
jgi:hypothetical protein